MKIEIRRSFEKDAVKLPAIIQVQLANAIQQITTAKKLSELSSCKKLIGFKNVTELGWAATVLVSFMKMTLWNWCVFLTERIFINIFLNNLSATICQFDTLGERTKNKKCKPS